MLDPDCDMYNYNPQLCFRLPDYTRGKGDGLVYAICSTSVELLEGRLLKRDLDYPLLSNNFPGFL